MALAAFSETHGDVNGDRIINGYKAPKGRYSYAVSLQDGRRRHFCGGSLIGGDVVLTAAHCVEASGSVLAVRIGSDDLDGGEVAAPSRAFWHAEYDIALVFLKERVGTEITPAGVNGDGSYPPPGSAAVAMGWGNTVASGGAKLPDKLMAVDLDVISNDKCEDARVGWISYSGLIEKSMICTYTKGQDACNGDSGGPLIIQGNDAREDVVVGVVSWGIGCAIFPGVYSRVSEGYGWIQKIVCKESSDPPGYLCGTVEPTGGPSLGPTTNPTHNPTQIPTLHPTGSPTQHPTRSPSNTPTTNPSSSPTNTPTGSPTVSPTTAKPTISPTTAPTDSPSASLVPSDSPSWSPTLSDAPTPWPSDLPSASTSPTSVPSTSPSGSSRPTGSPSSSSAPSVASSTSPSKTAVPTVSSAPSPIPSRQPSERPTGQPSTGPSSKPSSGPSSSPSASRAPSTWPSSRPSRHPSNVPSATGGPTMTATPTETDQQIGSGGSLMISDVSVLAKEEVIGNESDKTGQTLRGCALLSSAVIVWMALSA